METKAADLRVNIGKVYIKWVICIQNILRNCKTVLLIVGKKIWSGNSLKKICDGKYKGRNTEHQVIREMQI